MSPTTLGYLCRRLGPVAFMLTLVASCASAPPAGGPRAPAARAPAPLVYTIRVPAPSMLLAFVFTRSSYYEQLRAA